MSSLDPGSSKFGAAATGGSEDDLEMTEQERKMFRKFYLNLLQIPGEFESWMLDRVTISGLTIPVTQIQGFSQFTAQAATPVITTEGTTSATYTDLTTSGPTLTGLADGNYVILFGAGLNSSGATTTGFMGIKVNSTEAADDDACSGLIPNTTAAPGARAITKTLSNGGNNTLLARYRSDGVNNFQFRRRWLLALRYANI